MSYAGSMNPNRRAAILGGVAALHIGVGYLLVTGLAATIMEKMDPPLVANPMPLDPPSPPPPSQHATDKPRPYDPLVVPTTAVTVAPPTEGVIVTLPTVPPSSDGGGIGDVAFPTFTPSPSPSFAAVGPRPRGRPGEWVGPMDYPSTDLRLEHAGTTRVRLTIGSDGRVANCAVTGSSGWPGLDAATCARLTQRGRFEPATDTTGARVGGSFATSVTWEIPQ